MITEMTKTEKKIINNNEYEIRYLPALKNWQLGIKIAKIIGVSLEDIGDLLNNKDNSAFVKAIYNIINCLHENDKDSALILEILSQTTRNGVAVNSNTFNSMYTGNIHEMIEALFETLKFQFNHFLSEERRYGFQDALTKNQAKTTEKLTKI